MGVTLGLPTQGSSPDVGPIIEDTDVDITDPVSVLDRLQEAARELGGAIVDQLPLIVLGLVVFGIGLAIVGLIHRGIVRGTSSDRLDASVARLVQTLSRAVLVMLVVVLALSVAGVNVGALLAAIGIAGLAIAFALQSILENFIAGILLLWRKPFRPGDQVRLGDHEGVVDDIDLRVTTLIDYDGEVVLLPNATVFADPIINRTHRGRRRTTVLVGVDYRDDHDGARDVLLDAVRSVGGVLEDPMPVVQLSELGESSVDFAVRYWTMPEQAEVLRVQDKVLSAAKTALESAGMTIPWPIRTLVVDEDSTPALRALGRGDRGDRGGRADAATPSGDGRGDG